MVKPIKKISNLPSFSLIELIIIMSIVLLFSGLLLAQYGNFIEQSRLKGEASKLRDALELAKKKTIAKEVASCSIGFEGYEMTIRNDGYDLADCCSGVCNSSTPIHSYTLSSQTNTISITSGTGSIQFIPTPAGTTLTDDASITLRNSSIPTDYKCIQVTVTKVGIIGVQDTFISC